MSVRNVKDFVTDEVRISAAVLGKGSLAAIRTRSRQGVGRGIVIERRARSKDGAHSPVEVSSTGLSGGLLAVTADALFLLSTRAGLLHHRVTALVARVPLSEIHEVAFDLGTGALRIELADTTWEFDVAKRTRPDAALLAGALTGH